MCNSIWKILKYKEMYIRISEIFRWDRVLIAKVSSLNTFADSIAL